MTARPATDPLEVRGFVVAVWEEPAPYGQAARRVFATARLEDGRSCALVLAPAAAAIYVAAEDEVRARAVLGGEAAAWTELAGRALARFALAGDRLDAATRRLGEQGVAVLHVERARAADALHAAGVTGPITIRGAADDTADHAQLTGLGRALADALYAETTAAIAREFGVPSSLALRCEKAYRRFLIARLRSDPRAEARGRAKGYAGLRLAADDTTEVEVRGMEAVRSDVTPLARRFQVEMMRLLFTDAGAAALRACCAATARALARGELDHELIYSKVLRRPAEDYDAETPTVRAARLLGWTTQRGRIDYVMTRAGAEPVEARTAAAIDHAHYRERQLLPIARAIAEVLGEDADAWLGSPQLGLFGRAGG